MSCPEAPLVFINRHGLYVHVFDPHEGTSLDRQDHGIDGFFGSLDLQSHASVPFIPDPPGTAVPLRRMTGTVTETDSLYTSIKNDMFSNHILQLNDRSEIAYGLGKVFAAGVVRQRAGTFSSISEIQKRVP